MPEAAKEVLRKKILDVIGKRYIDLPEEEIESWIQYFAVPKGEKDGDTLDWRVVYDGGLMDSMAPCGCRLSGCPLSPLC